MRSLTVSEARTRAGSIRVDSYDIVLDMTRGDQHYASSTTIEFESLDRQATWVDIRPVELLAVQLNGVRVAPDTLIDGRLHLDGLQDRNTLVVEATMPFSQRRRGPAPHRRPRRRPALRLRDVLPGRGADASSPASTSPTSRRRTRFHVTRAARTGR